MKHTKLKSLTFWCTIWSIAMITFIILSGRSEFVSLTLALSAMPLAYAAKSTITKKYFNNGDTNNEISDKQ